MNKKALGIAFLAVLVIAPVAAYVYEDYQVQVREANEQASGRPHEYWQSPPLHTFISNLPFLLDALKTGSKH
jgi:hypothetical protein